jgi:hypothetical protein
MHFTAREQFTFLQFLLQSDPSFKLNHYFF